MRLLTFLLLEILLSPITLTGYVLLMLWATSISQQKQLSITALFPLFCRWLMHVQGIRPDPVADQLVQTLPSLNTGLNWATIGPTLFAMNLSGFTPSVFNVPPPGKENLGNMINTRTLFFDKAMSKYLGTMEQVVILGAGFDSRLFKFCLGQNLSLFEVDQRSTQQVKKAALRKSGIELTEITFVTVDFTRDDWMKSLIAEGFDIKKKTFWLWEGVTYYLPEAAVVDSLWSMAQVSGEGSAIAFDFFPQHFITGESAWWMPAATGLLDWIGEPFLFGVDMKNGNEAGVRQLLAGTGFELSELQMMGTRGGGAGFCGLAIATRNKQ